jgi:hypothetical protein
MGVVERVTPVCGTVSIHMSFVPKILLSNIHKDFSITGEYSVSRMTPTRSHADTLGCTSVADFGVSGCRTPTPGYGRQDEEEPNGRTTWVGGAEAR